MKFDDKLIQATLAHFGNLYESIMLTEDRIDYLKKNNPIIDTSHDTLAQHKDPSDIIDHFATHADPTKNKAHTQWIVGQYKKGNIRQEDAPRIKEALTNFDRYKGKLEVKDINKYQHISDLEDAVQPHLGTAASKGEEQRQTKDDGADLIHSEGGLTVHKLKTKEAACLYGKGTKWCTAADRNNMFDSYNSRGPLYVVQTPEKDKYQFHFESKQFMDPQDKPVALGELIEKHPQLKNVKEFKDKHPAFMEEHEQIHHVNSYENPKLVNNIISSNPKILSKVNEQDLVNNTISGHKATPVDQINLHAGVMATIAKHTSNPQTLDALSRVDTGNVYHISEVLKNKNTSTKTLDMIYSTHANKAAYIASHPNVSPETQRKIMSNASKEYSYVEAKQNLLSNPNATSEVLSNAANDSSNHLHRGLALSHQNLPLEDIHKNKDDVRTHPHLLLNPKLPTDVINHIANSPSAKYPHIAHGIAKNPNTSKDMLQSLIDHYSSGSDDVSKGIVKHAKANMKKKGK